MITLRKDASSAYDIDRLKPTSKIQGDGPKDGTLMRHRQPNNDIRALIDATGLSYATLASLLDANPKVVMAWYTGNRKPRHPAMLKKALQLVVLEQRGIITDKLIEQPTKP